MLPFRVMRMGATGGSSVDPDALSIYNKIVSWWEHATDASTALLDSHTGGRNLTATGSFSYGQAALAAGLPTCTKFNSTSSHMDALHASALNLGSSYSVMTWIKRDGAQAAFAKIIAKHTVSAEGKGTYYLFYQNSTGKLWGRFTSANVNYDITGATSLANLTPYQVIFNKNTTGSELFLNNVSDGTQASGGTPDVGGNNVVQGSIDSTDGFVGFCGGFAVFSSPLTTAERTYLYNGGTGVSYATLKTASGH